MDSSSSSSAATSLHIAMAALVGASIMAVSAFYIHKRSVDQVLNRLTELRRTGEKRSLIEQSDDEDDGGEEEEKDDESEFVSDGDVVPGRTIGGGGVSRSVDEKFRWSNRMSSSLPNVAFGHRGWAREDGDFDRGSDFRAQGFSSSLDKLNYIALGLPPLRTDQRHGILYLAI